MASGIKQIRLSPRRKTRRGVKRGTTLRAPTMAGERMAASLESLIDRMYRATLREIRALFDDNPLPTAIATDASIASQSRMAMNRLDEMFSSIFAQEAPKLSTEMVERADRASTATLGKSLRELSGLPTFKTNFSTAAVDDIFTASVAQSVGLIKRIPQEFLGEVQGEVMRSITTGSGLKDLEPYLEKKYNGAKKHARNVAMDQTRKAYNGLTVGRMKKVGQKKFEWVHSGGSNHPRPYHRDVLDGNVYSVDDPPVTNPSTGYRGLPGDEPYCRCSMRPIISFEVEDDE